jgi:predicted ATP-dependent endonuclease of OLD family
MAKKNTLLYLEDNLVRSAKQYGINISKLAEDAIKSSLFPILSHGQRIELDFDGYIKSMEGEKKAFFLPFEIKRAKLSNIGPHKELDVKLGKLNIILGKNGSGKTILLRAIASSLGFDDIYKDNMIKEESKKGEISVELKGNYASVVLESAKEPQRSFKCLLVDDPFNRLDRQVRKKLLEYLKRLDVQVIATSLPFEDIKNKSFNIINL